MSALSGPTEAWPGHTLVRVRYGETDQMGVVHHKVYLDYFEVARTELLRSHGQPYLDLERQGFMLPVVEAHVHYKQPARYDDQLEVLTRVERVRAADLRLGYRLQRGQDGTLLATAEITLACIGVSGRVRRLPQPLRQLLLSLSKEDRS